MPKSHLSNKNIEEIVSSRGKVPANILKKKYGIGSARLKKLWETSPVEPITRVTGGGMNENKLANGGGINANGGGVNGRLVKKLEKIINDQKDTLQCEVSGFAQTLKQEEGDSSWSYSTMALAGLAIAIFPLYYNYIINPPLCKNNTSVTDKWACGDCKRQDCWER